MSLLAGAGEEELLDLGSGERRALPTLEPRRTADGAAAAPAGLQLVAPTEEGLDVVDHEVADLADGVADRSFRTGDHHHPHHAPRSVDLLEALDGPEVPELAVSGETKGGRRSVLTARRLLARLVPLLQDRKEAVKHLLGLDLAIARAEGEVQRVDLVPGDGRAVRVDEADLVHQVLHLLFPHPLGVQDEPDAHHGVGVQVVRHDREATAVPSQLDRLRHLLAGGQGERADAAGVVVEAVAAALVLDLGALHGPVQIHRVFRHFLVGDRDAVVEDDRAGIGGVDPGVHRKNSSSHSTSSPRAVVPEEDPPVFIHEFRVQNFTQLVLL